MNDLKPTVIINDVSIIKNIGKVEISYNLFSENPTHELLSSLFSIFFPISIKSESIYMPVDTLIYVGYCKYFREVEKAEKIPTYEVTFKSNNGRIFVDEIKEVE